MLLKPFLIQVTNSYIEKVQTEKLFVFLECHLSMYGFVFQKVPLIAASWRDHKNSAAKSNSLSLSLFLSLRSSFDNEKYARVYASLIRRVSP